MVDGGSPSSLPNCLIALQDLERAHLGKKGECPNSIENKLRIARRLLISKKASPEQISELESYVVQEWKKFILNGIEEVISQIASSKVGGSKFVEIRQQIEKLREDIESEVFAVNGYFNMYCDLASFADQVQAEIELDNRRRNENIFWNALFALAGAVIGYLLGKFL